MALKESGLLGARKVHISKFFTISPLHKAYCFVRIEVNNDILHFQLRFHGSNFIDLTLVYL